MRRGIAYVYLSLLVATAVAVGLIAVMATYDSAPRNTDIPNEVDDVRANITLIRLASHYCVARASADQPNSGTVYNITQYYNLYAKSSGRPEMSKIECYNIVSSNNTYDNSDQQNRQVTVQAFVSPDSITARLDVGFLTFDVSMDTDIDLITYFNNSLGVADFKIKIYYKTVVRSVQVPYNKELLNVSIPIKYVESRLEAGNVVREYPVKVVPSDKPEYDWVISTSLVLDPTGPDEYRIVVDLFLFNGIKQQITITIRWGV